MYRKLNLNILLVFIFLSGQGQKNFIDQAYLDVTGQADTLLTPNEIFIKIIINEKDSRDRVSVEEQELKMYNAFKAMGIDVEKNLEASDLVSRFKYYLLKSKDIIKSKQYILKVGTADTAALVFMELENLGISNTSIERVSHTEEDKIRNEMRSRATADARVRALALTRPLGQSLGAAIHIADQEMARYSNQLSGRIPGVVITGYATRNEMKKELPKIDFEKIRVAAQVNVKFILKP